MAVHARAGAAGRGVAWGLSSELNEHDLPESCEHEHIRSAEEVELLQMLQPPKRARR